jgi:hypothetical protein
MQRTALLFLIMILSMIPLFTGCDEDKRVAEAHREAANRQAEQNRVIARQEEHLAAATRAVVEADAQASETSWRASAAISPRPGRGIRSRPRRFPPWVL